MSFVPPPDRNFERAAGSRADELVAQHDQRVKEHDMVAPRRQRGRLTDRLRALLRRVRGSETADTE